jgi:hypothetical protein
MMPDNGTVQGERGAKAQGWKYTRELALADSRVASIGVTHVII